MICLGRIPIRCGNIGEINIALFGSTVPTVHRRDRFREFRVVGLVDATCVNPEVINIIATRLFTTELNLLEASLAAITSWALQKIIKGYLLIKVLELA